MIRLIGTNWYSVQSWNGLLNGRRALYAFISPIRLIIICKRRILIKAIVDQRLPFSGFSRRACAVMPFFRAKFPGTVLPLFVFVFFYIIWKYFYCIVYSLFLLRIIRDCLMFIGREEGLRCGWQAWNGSGGKGHLGFWNTF